MLELFILTLHVDLSLTGEFLGDNEFFCLLVLDYAAALEELIFVYGHEGELAEKLRYFGVVG